MTTHQRKDRPGKPGAALTTTTIAASDSTRRTDTDADIALTGGANADIWAALFDGRFRLATRCSRCGRWLTAGPSKRAGIGAHCAAKDVVE